MGLNLKNDDIYKLEMYVKKMEKNNNIKVKLN